MIESSVFVLDHYLLKKINNRLTLFWSGVVFYSVGASLVSTQTLNISICRFLQLLGLLMILPSAFRLIKFRIENTYLRNIFFLYCIWCIGIIIRGFEFNYGFISQMLFFPSSGIFMYFAPLILLFPFDQLFFRKLFTFIFIFSLIFIVLAAIYSGILLSRDYDNPITQDAIEAFAKNISLPAGFLLLTYLYHIRKWQIVALITMALTLFITIVRARRGLIFLSSSMLIISFIIYLFTVKYRILVILISIIAIIFLLNNARELYNENKNGILTFLVERGTEDTRTKVELCYYEDMKPKDWIIGKGINGQYFCPGIDEDDETGYRNMIETDYLNIILKGGVISLGLLLIILLPGVILGLFFSKNILSKAASVWIILWILSLYPSPVLSFSLNYMLVWISVGICYSREIRNMSNDFLKQAFSKNFTPSPEEN